MQFRVYSSHLGGKPNVDLLRPIMTQWPLIAAITGDEIQLDWGVSHFTRGRLGTSAAFSLYSEDSAAMTDGIFTLSVQKCTLR